MVAQSEKRRVVQKHMDAIAEESGPIYGVRLIKTLPLGKGVMLQAMPSKRDLQDVQKVNERTVAGYEVLLSHYEKQTAEVAKLKGLMDRAMAIVTNAIMHGMPITPEVAAVRNEWVRV